MAAKFGIIRSMAKKGCSPGNAACEGFFGRMKNEMYYGRTWQTTQELEEAIAAYIELYNKHRIKISPNSYKHRRIPKSQSSVKLKLSNKTSATPSDLNPPNTPRIRILMSSSFAHVHCLEMYQVNGPEDGVGCGAVRSLNRDVSFERLGSEDEELRGVGVVECLRRQYALKVEQPSLCCLDGGVGLLCPGVGLEGLRVPAGDVLGIELAR